MTNVTAEQVEAGQAVYTKRTLALYDFVVLGVSNRFLWECPTQRLQEHYNKHVTANHLDVGVGTGYFIDRCRFPSPTPRIALMDLNVDTLKFASQRIARYKPETYRRNVLDPISLETIKFDSVGINYLLHCVPGSIESKVVTFDHLKVLNESEWGTLRINPSAERRHAELVCQTPHGCIQQERYLFEQRRQS
jgi:ubiquinone/menaquinone biosynthesis C-methylase UbiE